MDELFFLEIEDSILTGDIVSYFIYFGLFEAVVLAYTFCFSLCLYYAFWYMFIVYGF